MAPTHFPSGPSVGKPSCRYQDSSGTYRYADANLTTLEQLARGLDTIRGTVAPAVGVVAAGGEAAAKGYLSATGLEHGASGLVSRLTGVPRWLVIGAALGAGYLVMRPYLGSR